MKLRVLGPLDLEVDGVSTSVTSSRLRRLLAALSIDPGQVARADHLADAIWADQPPDNTGAALQTLVSRLRRQLAAAGARDVIVTRPPGYLLDVASDVIDAVAFEAAHERARTLADSDPSTAVEVLTEALALWRGPAYVEFADESFALPRVAQLDEARAIATELQVDCLLRLGDVVQAARIADSLRAAYPYREQPQAQLMIALYRSGRQTDALAAYEAYRTRIADELGLDPSPRLQAVQVQILNADTALDPPRPRRAGNVPPASRHELIGRAADVETVRAAVLESPAVTLTGPGGVGKTSLALAIASDPGTGAVFVDGVWWCELAALSAGDAIADAIATTLGLQTRLDADPIGRLVEALGARRALIVLDNCEHLVDAAAEIVAAINRGCPHIVVVATSREALGIDAERVVPVNPLAEDAAVALLVDRATDAVPGFVRSDDNAAALAEISRRLDGLPLALELAAIRMRAISADDLAARLTWRFRLLRQGVRTAPGRHQTLEAVVRWSYELLDDTDRMVLELVSVFAGSFSLESAEELVTGATADSRSWEPGEVAGVVLSLADRSMVVAMAGSPQATRWRLLETIRAYGRARLAERTYADDVPDLHAELFARMLAYTHEALFGPEHGDATALVETEFDDLRAAVAWAIDHQPAAAVEIIGGLLPYSEHRMPIEPLGWAERLIEVIDATGESPAHLARVFAVAASCARFVGELEYAHQLIERGLAVVEPSDITEAHLRYLQAEVSLFRGNIEEGGRYHELFTASALRAGQPALIVLAEVMDVLKIAYEGDEDEAVRRADELAVHAAAFGPRDTVAAWAAYTRGEVLIDRDPARAQILLDDALHRSRLVGDRYLTGVTLVSVASLAARHGDPKEAAVLYIDVIEHWFAVGDWTHQWTTIRNIVDLLARLGAYAPAAVLLGALDSRAAVSGSTGFGAELERTEAVREVVATELDPGERTELSRRGAAMSDDEVVDYVLAELDARGRQSSR